MKISYFFSIVFIVTCLNLFATQKITISGKVQDKSTNKAMQYVQVYADGTTLGCLSDEQGNFEFEVPAGFQYKLVASMVGYAAFNDKIEGNKAQSFLIPLEPKLQDLNEVLVHGLNKRADNLKAFRSAFLGNDEFGKSCAILNDSVIHFNQEKNYQIISSCAPLKIKNNKLAYYILADIVFCGYEINGNHSVILTNLFFVDLAYSLKRGAYKEVLANRRKAYYGNRQHFLKALFNNELEKEGFLVLSKKEYLVDSLTQSFQQKLINRAYLKTHSQLNQTGTIRSVQLDSASRYQVYCVKKFGKPRDISEELIAPLSKRNLRKLKEIGMLYPYSEFYLKEDQIDVSNTGNAGIKLFFKGRMGNSRYGSVLPLDYDPKSKSE